jgi:hypothetical protein
LAVLEPEDPVEYGQTEGKALLKQLYCDLIRIRCDLDTQLYAERHWGECVIRETDLPLLGLLDEVLATITNLAMFYQIELR